LIVPSDEQLDTPQPVEDQCLFYTTHSGRLIIQVPIQMSST